MQGPAPNDSPINSSNTLFNSKDNSAAGTHIYQQETEESATGGNHQKESFLVRQYFIHK